MNERERLTISYALKDTVADSIEDIIEEMGIVTYQGVS